MEQAVALMIGIVALPMGLSLFIRSEEWSKWFQYLRTQGDNVTLIIGYFHLIIGAFIVAFHWEWHGLSVLVTLVGVTAILEGTVYTLFPRYLQTMLAWCEPRQRTLFSVTGLMAIIVAGVAFCEYAKLI
jgi:uncharacterized protein YjeT (DUF2065 family)